MISSPTGTKMVIQIGHITPATIPNIFPGDYTYKLKLIGYQDKTGLFTITPGQIPYRCKTTSVTGRTSRSLISSRCDW